MSKFMAGISRIPAMSAIFPIWACAALALVIVALPLGGGALVMLIWVHRWIEWFKPSVAQKTNPGPS